MKKFFEEIPGWARFWRANAVLLLDRKFKRNPKVADRLKYFRDQEFGLLKMYRDPKKRQKLPPDMEQNLRLMTPMLRMMEQAIKKNPELTMKDLEEISRNPELQAPRIRTRPGPPMRGRRKF